MREGEDRLRQLTTSRAQEEGGTALAARLRVRFGQSDTGFLLGGSEGGGGGFYPPWNVV